MWYGCQDTGENVYFSAFKLGFMVVFSLFLQYWRLICYDLRYGCQDMGEKVHLPDLKSGLRHLPFYF